jgi:hypothetical protein
MGSPARDAGPHSGSKDLVVFSILRDSKCVDCGEVLGSGQHLFIESGRPLCLRCADLDHLVFLPAGDAALTRRARKYSALSAVVVHFSRSRGRYERQGLLVEEIALQRAEEECLGDADKRAALRAREEMRRIEQDHELAARMADTILALFPGCPPPEAHAIATHTAVRGSGRVGRTAAGKALEPEAITVAVIAAIRHNHTRYDALLMGGYSRTEARDRVREAVGKVLTRWRGPHNSN